MRILLCIVLLVTNNGKLLIGMRNVVSQTMFKREVLVKVTPFSAQFRVSCCRANVQVYNVTIVLISQVPMN
jgi:hypothetical protein